MIKCLVISNKIVKIKFVPLSCKIFSTEFFVYFSLNYAANITLVINSSVGGYVMGVTPRFFYHEEIHFASQTNLIDSNNHQTVIDSQL